MRLTYHNSRGKVKNFSSADHDDRNFDLEKADHINSTKSIFNDVEQFMGGLFTDGFSLSDGELNFYREHFEKALSVQNARNDAARNSKRNKTIEDYLTAMNTRPEMSILSIGCKGNTVDGTKLKEIVDSQLQWERERFPQVHILSRALHVDEQGAPHVHTRKVWIAHNKDGNEIVSQKKCLAEMGVLPPNPEKPTSKYNNAKMTYSKACREHFIELCIEHGLEIETEPKERSKTGLSLVEYQARQEEARIAQKQAELHDLNEKLISNYKKAVDDLRQKDNLVTEHLNDLRRQLLIMSENQLREMNRKLKDDLDLDR